MSDFAFRPARPADVPFVMSNWIKPFRNTPWAGVIPNNLFHDTTRIAIEQLIARGIKIEVAHVPGNEDRLVAFCASEVTRDGFAVVHSLYVKDPYVAFQVGEKLVERCEGSLPGFYTFRTPLIERTLGKQWRHAPEIARRR